MQRKHSQKWTGYDGLRQLKRVRKRGSLEEKNEEGRVDKDILYTDVDTDNHIFSHPPRPRHKHKHKHTRSKSQKIKN